MYDSTPLDVWYSQAGLDFSTSYQIFKMISQKFNVSRFLQYVIVYFFPINFNATLII